jgi:hypothetical protein
LRFFASNQAWATATTQLSSRKDRMWDYHIDENRHLVITTAWDTLTGADILEHRRKLKSDPCFHRCFSQLVDLTHLTSVALDYKAVDELSREHVFARKSLRAFVAPSLLAYGMSRMFISIRALTGGAERMEVFKNRNEALRWLRKPDSKSPTTHSHTSDDLWVIRK